MPDIGVTVSAAPGDVPALARLAEEAGFESVWVAETSSSAWVAAALACHSTSRVKVGTNIALAFPRSPTLTAMAARDLAELSGGRFVLGLGSQVKAVNERRFSVPFEHPAPKMREYVEVVRKVLGAFGGGPIEHRGRFYTVTMPPFPGGTPVGTVPIYVAAVNERMAEAAGRVADGVLGHPMTSPAYVAEVLRPAVQRGAAAGGRDPSEVSVTTSVIVQASDDVERARFEAALQIGFYATTRTYAPVLALHGFADRVAPLREAHARGDLSALADIAMPMVDAFAIVGPAEACRERLAAYEGVVDRLVLGGAWVGPSREELVAHARALIEAFAPTG